MRISVILSTYNQPRWLELVLWGYAVQSRPDFELIVADDGSDAETRDAIRRVEEETGRPVRHVWHEHRGFRKTELLNWAILESTGEYLIFSDGDCVPRRDFVEVHASRAEPGRFLSGGCLRLASGVSDRVTPEAVRSGDVFRRDWLRQQGWRPGRRALRLASPSVGALLDRLTPTRRTWNGHNASTWRDAVLAVNGFDGDMGYGGLDRALGERLRNLGLRGKQIRFRAVCLHLHHERPYVDPTVLRYNREVRRAIRRERRIRARVGIAELTPLAR
jgi:glycosyltransferase involved in cell wall biosynthesis